MLDVKVQNLFFSYIGGQRVLEDVNVTFSPGTTAIIGQNGAGKTTLMKLLNGLLKPSAGTVHIGEMNAATHDVSELAKYVGIVFQNPDAQIFNHTIENEVKFGPLNIGKSPEQARELALEALSVVGLQHRFTDNPYDLSYSERKLVCVASILAMNPDVVILDEPTMSQDSAGLRLMGDIVKRLKMDGKTVIGIVHDMNFAAEFFDEIVVMAEGTVLKQGAVRDVFSDTQTLRTAHVEAPSMGKLSLRVGLPSFSVTTKEFVDNFRRTFDVNR